LFKFPKMRFLLIFFCFATSTLAQEKVWLDTDLMIGLPTNAPREVDDALAIMMALKHTDKIQLVGISTITNVVYANRTAKNLLKWYNKGKPIPVYGGSDSANDVGVENDATRALEKALGAQKLTILAIGPLTNIATVLKNHPELGTQIVRIVVCAGREEKYPFKLGIGDLVVWDYNFETDVEAFRVVLESMAELVLSGFQCSESLLLGRADISALNNNHPGDKWVYKQLLAWQNSYKTIFGVPAFVPWDTTPLGYITHPQYFKYYKNIPVQINKYQNDANAGPNLGKEKYFLEASKDFTSPYKVTFAYKTMPGFEEIVIDALKR
jgi:inosine-uridine nucleoside N-ribohydrolase